MASYSVSVWRATEIASNWTLIWDEGLGATQTVTTVGFGSACYASVEDPTVPMATFNGQMGSQIKRMVIVLRSLCWFNMLNKKLIDGSVITRTSLHVSKGINRIARHSRLFIEMIMLRDDPVISNDYVSGTRIK